jgi:hypothetical protein
MASLDSSQWLRKLYGEQKMNKNVFKNFPTGILQYNAMQCDAMRYMPKSSMKAIVMFFTNKTKTDSEEYVYPNINKVRVTVEGVPISVYSQGIPKTRFYEEAKRIFGATEASDNSRLSV